jgi:nicotinate-nucleotide adenylyltransferase
MSSPLVLLGGTFDPPHRAHIALLRAAGHALGMMQHMQLLIAADPWQKSGVTPLAHRLAILKLALKDEDTPTPTRISINTFETEYASTRSVPTYSIDTLQAIREANGHVPITFVMGWDQWLNLPTWQRWRELTSYAHLCIAPRVNTFGSPSAELEEWSEFKFASEHQLREQPSGYIFQLPLFEQPISSTALRAQLREGRYAEASPWLHPSVLRYIQANQLYREH